MYCIFGLVVSLEIFVASLIGISILSYALTGNIILSSVATFAALLINLVYYNPSKKILDIIRYPLMWAIIFFTIGSLASFDDFNPLGHWINVGRIANQNWPVNNPLIPELPLPYHWGSDAIASFVKWPFGHRLSISLALAITQTSAWLFQIRAINLVLGDIRQSNFDKFLRFLCIPTVLFGTQWLFIPGMMRPLTEYIWVGYNIDGYRIVDSVFAFGVHQRGFVFGFSMMFIVSVTVSQMIESLTKFDCFFYAFISGLILSSLVVIHVVVFAITFVSTFLVCAFYSINFLSSNFRMKNCFFVIGSAGLISIPSLVALRGVGILAGSNQNDLSRVIELAAFGYPRGGSSLYGILFFWLIWFGPLIAILCIVLFKFNLIRKRKIPLRIQFLLVSALLAFSILFRFDHPNKWDGSKFLITGTASLTCAVMYLSELIVIDSRVLKIRLFFAIPLLLNLPSLVRQITMFRNINPPDVQASLFRGETQPDHKKFLSDDGLLIPDDNSYGRSVVWIASNLGMRESLYYEYLSHFAISSAVLESYVGVTNRALKLEDKALRELNIRVITFRNTNETKSEQEKVHNLGFSPCGYTSGAGSLWPLWCR